MNPLPKKQILSINYFTYKVSKERDIYYNNVKNKYENKKHK